MLVVISSNECQLLGLVYTNIRTRIIIIDEELFGLAVARVGIFILFLLSLTWCSGCSQSRESAAYTHFGLLLFRDKHCSSSRWASTKGSVRCGGTCRRNRREGCKTLKTCHAKRLLLLDDWGRERLVLHLGSSVLLGILLIIWLILTTKLREILLVERCILVGVKNSIVV